MRSLKALASAWWNPGLPLAVGGPSQNTKGLSSGLPCTDFSKAFVFFQRPRISSSSLGKSTCGLTLSNFMPLTSSYESSRPQGGASLHRRDGSLHEALAVPPYLSGTSGVRSSQWRRGFPERTRCNGLARPVLLTSRHSRLPLSAGGSGRMFGPPPAPGFHHPRLALTGCCDPTRSRHRL